jgi:ATPase subunit of ABC transporter with duplicated ATPase domains
MRFRKSTLLKIMAGVDTEYDGLARPLPGASIGYLPQEPNLDKYETVQECIDEAVASSQAILDKYNDLSMKLADPDISDDEMTETMNQIEKLNDQIEAGDLWEMERVVSRAMESLRVPPGDAKIATLSGGEKRRTAICKLLLGNHDMLLLDEPTNHLDAESIAWLEEFLDQFKGTVVCITHDRYFLNNCAGWILELDRGKGYPHEGNYETFLEAKTKRLEEEQKQQTAASKAVANELEWIRTNPKAKGNKSKARLNRYDELLAAAAPKELRNAGQIYIPPGPRLGNEVIEVLNLKKSFGDRLLIDNLSFSLPPAGIIGVVGPNGTND